MILKNVTITGADDNSDPSVLCDISEQFPFVEWGILWYPEKMGKSRYPSREWIQKFIEEKSFTVNSSLHICGKDAIDFGYKYPRSEAWSYIPAFGRVQLNFPWFIADLDRTMFLLNKRPDFDLRHMIFQYHLMDREGTVIIQANEKNRILNSCLEAYPYVEFLFDQSRGNGITISEYPEPIFSKCNGYAGGISPDNVLAILYDLKKIIPEDGKIWIDMETGVRVDDDLDISKVMDILLMCEEYKRKNRI